MQHNEIEQIKNKILKIDPKRWWGDIFDVRFYLILQLKNIQNKIVLDVGGGIGIISSCVHPSNFRINLDISIEDLKKSKTNFPKINNICASRTHLPFKKNSIDIIICAHILAGAKAIDIKNNSYIKKGEVFEYPTIEKTIKEISRCLMTYGTLFITATNNEFYKTKKLNYFELKHSISKYFKNYKIFFFNTLPSFNKNYSKMNLSNIIPKIRSKISNQEKILFSLIKEDKGKNRKSVSFFLEINN